jgi:uncharacterized membrane protein YsdA (DUF1294 family)
MDGTLLLSSPLLLLFGIVNSVAWLIMLWDKKESRKSGAERISEGMLFFLATIGGSIGIYLGMFMFRHKTRKWYFFIGIPVLIFENVATLTVLVGILK